MIEIARPQPNWISNSSAARYHVIKEMLSVWTMNTACKPAVDEQHFPIMENVLLFGWAEIGRIA